MALTGLFVLGATRGGVGTGTTGVTTLGVLRTVVGFGMGIGVMAGAATGGRTVGVSLAIGAGGVAAGLLVFELAARGL